MENLRQIIQKQKQERDLILTTTSIYVKRNIQTYAEGFMENSLIKVILGPRRAGKSSLAFMLLKNTNFAYINFDDELLPRDLNTIDLIDILKDVYGDFKYIFFDEIQNLDKWELYINKLHRNGYNVIVTGSNAHLLSRDLSTHLTGRHISFEVLPFSYSEIKDLNIDLNSFIKNGGYPEINLQINDTVSYLGLLFDSVVYKDIVSRYSIRTPNTIETLSGYLVNNMCNQFTYNNVANLLNIKSEKTVEKYIGYLKNSYLFYTLNRYSNKDTVRIKSPKKIYMVDNGFYTSKVVSFTDGIGKLFENFIFTELLKNKYQPDKNLFYYKTRNGREVDFVIKENNTIKKLIQVSVSVTDRFTLKRECDALIEAGGELKTDELCIVCLYDKSEAIEFNGKSIHVVNFKDWKGV